MSAIEITQIEEVKRVSLEECINRRLFENKSAKVQAQILHSKDIHVYNNDFKLLSRAVNNICDTC